MFPHTLALPATIRGRQLLVGGAPVHLKGVNWNPVGKGKKQPEGVDWRGFADRDADLMKAAGINVLRTYSPLTDRRVLDALWARRIQVLSTVFSGGESEEQVRQQVLALRDHPAILMWVLGNEWNYNGCYQRLPHVECRDRILRAARVVKQLDGDHPTATVYGMPPMPEVYRAMPEIDVWAINYYKGPSFGALWDYMQNVIPKAWLLGEFGADAYDTLSNQEDQEAQAFAITSLTKEIVQHSSVTGGTCLGGLLFEWADEWWKQDGGDVNVQETTGHDWGNGPHPDYRFNEEWFGIVTVDRQPRRAYAAYRDIAVPSGAAMWGAVGGARGTANATAGGDGNRRLAPAMLV